MILPTSMIRCFHKLKRSASDLIVNAIINPIKKFNIEDKIICFVRLI